MALLSVQRQPTILGTKTASVNRYFDGPGSAPFDWYVLRSGDFTSQGGGALTGTTLRFHTITVSNNGPVSVRMVLDTSTAATATTNDYSFGAGLSLEVGEVLTLDVSSLGGAQGIRRVLLVKSVFGDTTTISPDAPPYAAYAICLVDFQVGFYTPHQSA